MKINQNKGKLIINNKKVSLKEMIHVKDNTKIKILMILSESVINKSYMFKDCYSLESLLQLSFEKKSEILQYITNDFQKGFDNIIVENGNKTLPSFTTDPKLLDKDHLNFYDNNDNNITISDIIKSTTNNDSIIEIKNSTLNNLTLLNLYDKIKYNYYNIINTSSMFYNCKSLSSLPDISKWNVSNIMYMNNMFYNCESLSKIPDISSLNTGNVYDISGIFHNCKSLKSLPDISKWKTNNVIYG